MKRAILILVMVTGCSTPCDDFLTSGEQELFQREFDGLRLTPREISFIALDICPWDLECRECIEWILN